MRALLFLFVLILALPAQAEEYHRATMQNLSKLYWGLGMLDIGNKDHVDNYLKINECALYTSFFYNEFEWRELSESGRDNIQKFIDGDYPKRFEYMQRTFLGDYDFENGTFSVPNKFKIDHIYRFEVQAENTIDSPCTRNVRIPDYPTGLAIELNRPLTFFELPVEPEIAKAYIKEKTKNLQRKHKSELVTEERFESRDAYLNLQFIVKDFRSVLDLGGSDQLIAVSAELESYEVYGDQDKALLLHTHKVPPPRIIFDPEQNRLQGNDLLP